jgi:hypothetical protein
MPYETLNPDEVIATVGRLKQRIEDRFPGSGLGRVCSRLLEISHQASERAKWIERPIIRLRVGTWLLATALIAVIGYVVYWLKSQRADFDLAEAVQMIDAGTSTAIVVGGLLFFVISTERRMKRRRALEAIDELRSLAHIIDMHQLTKDPERLRARHIVTSHSPQQKMTAFELDRYLDYCSEMLALTGKVAAIYAQAFDDAVALEAVNDVENLTTSLARKIWQKIMVLHTFETARS